MFNDNLFISDLQEMKSMLYAAVEQAPSAELVDPEVLTRYFTKFDEQFFHFSDKELTKINTFYSGKFKEFKIYKEHRHSSHFRRKNG